MITFFIVNLKVVSRNASDCEY